MKIYKCDRCDRELDPYYLNKVKVREWDGSTYHYHLCIPCTGKVFDLIEHGGDKK